MSIAVGNINTLVSHTVCDIEAHINQQADVAMADTMDSYSFYAIFCTATADAFLGFGRCDDIFASYPLKELLFRVVGLIKCRFSNDHNRSKPLIIRLYIKIIIGGYL